MKMNIILSLFIFILTITTSVASSTDNILCDGTRLTPSNYPFRFKKTKRALKKIETKNFLEAFKMISNKNTNSSELCAWNKFLFVDFFIYFDRFESLGFDKSLNFEEVLKLRDNLYYDWGLKNYSGSYSDYSHTNLEGVSLDEFLSKKSEHFSFIQGLVNLVNSRPKKNKAKAYIYDLIGARTPFNSLFTKKAIEVLLQEKTKTDLECILLENGEELQAKLKQCFSSKDRMLEILGVLASQRMYIIRDLASYMKQNLSDSEYELFYMNALNSSSLYFKLETEALTHGANKVYPLDSNELKSPKPYHFYSVAYIANELKRAGFSNKEIEATANFYAKKYKKNIKLIGYIYNAISGIPLKNGSTGDAKQIQREQEIGINYILNEEEK